MIIAICCACGQNKHCNTFVGEIQGAPVKAHLCKPCQETPIEALASPHAIADYATKFPERIPEPWREAAVSPIRVVDPSRW